MAPARMDTTETDALDRADMERLVAGEEAALNRLMERHAAAVFHFLLRMLGSEDDANDLAQETFVRVYRARESYRPQQRFSTWLYTIAANLARNQFRWRSRHPTVSLNAESEATDQTLGDSLPGPAATPHQAAESSERVAAVRAAVQRLPDDLREAIVLCEWEDLPVAEAAAVLRTTPKAVESRLYRARQRLRERLEEWL
jgi:RNA polymerase sigma-70 factor, ECF subfamily